MGNADEEDDMGGIEPANDPVLVVTGLLPNRSKPPELPLGLAGAPNPDRLLLLVVLLARAGGRTEAIVGL